MVSLHRKLPSWLLLVLLLLAPTSVFAQASQTIALHVSGEVRNRLDLSLVDIAAFPRQTISVTDEKGTQVEYEGVPVAEILHRAGAPLGKDLKGPNMALGLIARASDGYRVLFSLTEFDAAFSERVILLADRRDGKPLDSREGPLRIVVPGDRRHARWIRGVTTLEVVRVP
jgi:DMSO/TMAO reductase YedYZ molybdopterin-dependent catalytic subunit